MTTKQRMVPNLRFNGFYGNWKKKKGKQLFVSKSDKGFPYLPVLSATQDKGMIFRNKSGIDIKYKKKSLTNYKRVQPGDFVVHLRSFQGGFAYSNINGIASPAYTIFTFKNPQEFDDNFWKEKFTSYNFIQFLKKVTYGVRDGRSISYHGFLTLSENFPTVQEQSKIGDLLNQFDNLISLQQRRLSLLKQLKKGLLQKMFADKNSKRPVLRFKGFHDDWESYMLDNITVVKDGTHSSPTYQSKGYPLITSKNLTANGISLKDVSYISKNDFDEINKRSLVEKNDILFGMIGTIGNPVLVNKPGFAIKNVALIKNTNKINEFFLLNFFLSNSFKRYCKSLSTGNTQKFLALNQIRSCPITIPSKNESTQIGKLLGKISNLVSLQQRKLTYFQSIKKSLLQQMFI